MSVLKNVQEEHKEWSKHNFGLYPAWHPLLGAVEEIGELAHAYLKREQHIRIGENHSENMRDAIADIIIYLCDFATLENIDVEDTLREVWRNVKNREWKENPVDGNKDI